MFQWRSIFLRTLSSPLSCLQARNERESEGVVCAVTEIAEGGNELKRSAQQALGPEGDIGALCLSQWPTHTLKNPGDTHRSIRVLPLVN